jgi:hypothetical protein
LFSQRLDTETLATAGTWNGGRERLPKEETARFGGVGAVRNNTNEYINDGLDDETGQFEEIIAPDNPRREEYTGGFEDGIEPETVSGNQYTGEFEDDIEPEYASGDEEVRDFD